MKIFATVIITAAICCGGFMLRDYSNAQRKAGDARRAYVAENEQWNEGQDTDVHVECGGSNCEELVWKLGSDFSEVDGSMIALPPYRMLHLRAPRLAAGKILDLRTTARKFGRIVMSFLTYPGRFPANQREDKNMESIGKRVKANHYRKQLTNGYRPDSTFYRLVYRLSDEMILQNHAEHNAETAEHQSMVTLYKSRMTEEKQSKPDRFAQLCAAASR